MASDLPPPIAPLVVPVLGLLQAAFRHFGDGFHHRVGACFAPDGRRVAADVWGGDFDSQFGDSGHTRMLLARLRREQDVVESPLIQAVQDWAKHIARATGHTTTVVVDCDSLEGATGWVRFGQHGFTHIPTPDGIPHSVHHGLLDRALRVVAKLGGTRHGPEWSLLDSDQTRGNDSPARIVAADAADAFALFGAEHNPELWTSPTHSRWQLVQHHTLPGLDHTLARFG